MGVLNGRIRCGKGKQNFLLHCQLDVIFYIYLKNALCQIVTRCVSTYFYKGFGTAFASHSVAQNAVNNELLTKKEYNYGKDYWN